MNILANAIHARIHDNILLIPNDIAIKVSLRKIGIITWSNVPFAANFISSRQLTTFIWLLWHVNIIRDRYGILIYFFRDGAATTLVYVIHGCNGVDTSTAADIDGRAIRCGITEIGRAHV